MKEIKKGRRTLMFQVSTINVLFLYFSSRIDLNRSNFLSHMNNPIRSPFRIKISRTARTICCSKFFFQCGIPRSVLIPPISNSCNVQLSSFTIYIHICRINRTYLDSTFDLSLHCDLLFQRISIAILFYNLVLNFYYCNCPWPPCQTLPR